MATKSISRENELGIMMIDDDMRKLIFGDKPAFELDVTDFADIADTYKRFGLPFPVDQSTQIPMALRQAKFQMPPLETDNIISHMDHIAQRYIEPIEAKIIELYKAELPNFPIDKLLLVDGWVRYGFDGSIDAVDEPLEPYMVGDCETFVQKGNQAVMFGAVTHKAWYLWLHPSLVADIEYMPMLVSFGKDKLIVAHNASFDKARIAEAYDLATSLKFIDTMSLHIATAGLGGGQRWGLNVPVDKQPQWVAHGCANSLVACYNHYCFPQVPLGADAKALRNIFVDSSEIGQIKMYLIELIAYMMDDVRITHELLGSLWPRYRHSNPSPITLSGILRVGSSQLPVVDDWFDWAIQCDVVWDKMTKEITATLEVLAQKLIAQFNSGELTQEQIDADPWYSQLDWGRRSNRVKTGKGEVNWFWHRGELTTKNRLSHILMRLSWEKHPLVWRAKEGWMIAKNWGTPDIEYEKPYHDEENAVTVMLCREYGKFFDSGVLTSNLPDETEAIGLVTKAISLSYWTSVRGRVFSQLVANGTNQITGKPSKVIVPSLVVHGTVTRRCMEPLWLTVTKTKYNRIGTELKSRVAAPEDCVFISADHDGQELRIASILADSAKKTVGSSLMSFSVIAGDKNLGTDAHTMLAKYIDIDRETAKTCYYALLYGAGIKTLVDAFKWTKIGWSFDSLKEVAQKVIDLRKGKKIRGSRRYAGGTDSEAFSQMEVIAYEPIPRTPILGSAMTAPMRTVNVGTQFHTGRVNWVIQSSGVDQLHLFVTALEYLFDKYKIRARFIWSYHDEMLAVSHKDDACAAAWLFQVAHCWCWSYTAAKRGVEDLPLAGAFFSGVAVDKYFRKSAHESLVTLSNDVAVPDGIEYKPADFIEISEEFNKKYG